MYFDRSLREGTPSETGRSSVLSSAVGCRAQETHDAGVGPGGVSDRARGVCPHHAQQAVEVGKARPPRTPPAGKPGQALGREDPIELRLEIGVLGPEKAANRPGQL